MSVELGVVEIPGLADAYRQERGARREAFVELPGGVAVVAGLPVRLLTLRLWHRLQVGMNGHVVPCRFETDAEVYAHALDFFWKLSPDYRQRRRGIDWRYLWLRARWRRRAGNVAPLELVGGVTAYLEETFFDCPFGGNTTTPKPGQRTVKHAGNYTMPAADQIASAVDLFAAGGYSWGFDAIVDLPLVRLWQFIRLIRLRLYGSGGWSPSSRAMDRWLCRQHENN